MNFGLQNQNFRNKLEKFGAGHRKNKRVLPVVKNVNPKLFRTFLGGGGCCNSPILNFCTKFDLTLR